MFLDMDSIVDIVASNDLIPKRYESLSALFGMLMEEDGELNSEYLFEHTNAARERLTPLEWAQKYRLIKGKPMDFDKFPYQKQILDDMSPKQVIEKGAQLGLSEVFLTKAFWFCDYNVAGSGGKIIYTFPTYSDMLTYASARIPQIIDDSKVIEEGDYGFEMRYLEEPESYISTMIETNNAKVKKVRDTFMFMKGTFGDSSAISIDSDFNVHDEVNFSNQSVLNKFKSRLGAATSLGWEYNFSTPTIPGYGVSKMYQKSDMHMWSIRCPHCDKVYALEYERNCKELGYGKGHKYMCHYCHNEITDETRAKGFYVCESSSVKNLRGYHIDKMCNPGLSADSLAKSKDDYRKVSDFYNFDLGLPYSEKSTALTQEALEELYDAVGYRYQMQAFAKWEDEVCIGVDQGDDLWIEVTAKCHTTGKRKIIYLERTDFREYDDEDHFQRLPELIERYRARVTVIDALPNKNSSRWLKNKYKDHPDHHVYTAYYTHTRDGDVNVNETDHAVNIDRTEMFKHTFNQLFTGEYAIPEGSEAIHVWMSHMQNLKKESVENEDNGDVREAFVKLGADHYNHAHLYNEVARQIMDDKLKINKTGGGSRGRSHWGSDRDGFAKEKNNGSSVGTAYGGAKPVPKSKLKTVRKTR